MFSFGNKTNYYELPFTIKAPTPQNNTVLKIKYFSPGQD